MTLSYREVAGRRREVSQIKYTINRMGHVTVFRVSKPEDSLYFQADWDYASLANAWGWTPEQVVYEGQCHHFGTDGTVACPACGCPVGDFLDSAYKWLQEHEGTTAEDPGMWQGEESEEM